MIGTGILKGMAVTARNFVGSYIDKARLITAQYPEERNPLPENYRNSPLLIYDDDDPQAGLRCVACKICETDRPRSCRRRSGPPRQPWRRQQQLRQYASRNRHRRVHRRSRRSRPTTEGRLQSRLKNLKSKMQLPGWRNWQTRQI